MLNFCPVKFNFLPLNLRFAPPSCCFYCKFLMSAVRFPFCSTSFNFESFNFQFYSSFPFCIVKLSFSALNLILRHSELLNYLQNYQSYVLGSGIVLSTGNRGSPRSCSTTDSWSVKKVGIVKVLKLFSYLQNHQSYGSGSVKQSPKIDILFPTGNGSSPILTKLCVNISHEASTSP